MKQDPLLSIGEVAKRTGANVSAIRFYADQTLIPTVRSASGHRLFNRSVIRRVSFILIMQGLGYSLKQVASALESLPDNRTPTKSDWNRLSRQFSAEIDQRIAQLNKLKGSLTRCIGCGCLSLQKCQLYNANDRAAALGDGPRYFIGDDIR
ncbi:redox-sensitive transcriptional activator SoxR [Arenicella xantha]|nr:redox-sensitive transcriptional activator SoxR [Arenicella xantha]